MLTCRGAGMGVHYGGTALLPFERGGATRPQVTLHNRILGNFRDSRERWNDEVLPPVLLKRGQQGRRCLFIIESQGIICFFQNFHCPQLFYCPPTLPYRCSDALGTYAAWWGVTTGGKGAQFPRHRITIGAPSDCGGRRKVLTMSQVIFSKQWELLALKTFWRRFCLAAWIEFFKTCFFVNTNNFYVFKCQ